VPFTVPPVTAYADRFFDAEWVSPENHGFIDHWTAFNNIPHRQNFFTGSDA